MAAPPRNQWLNHRLETKFQLPRDGNLSLTYVHMLRVEVGGARGGYEKCCIAMSVFGDSSRWSLAFDWRLDDHHRIAAVAVQVELGGGHARWRRRAVRTRPLGLRRYVSPAGPS
jgi:hypothetical protein